VTRFTPKVSQSTSIKQKKKEKKEELMGAKGFRSVMGRYNLKYLRKSTNILCRAILINRKGFRNSRSIKTHSFRGQFAYRKLTLKKATTLYRCIMCSRHCSYATMKRPRWWLACTRKNKAKKENLVFIFVLKPAVQRTVYRVIFSA
jgi:hypothetical protein